MTQENHQKRIVTNEDLLDRISSFQVEMKVTTEDLYNSILRLEGSVDDLRKSTLDGFDRVFQTIDDARAELKAEFKSDITDLRKEMNQRFSLVDKKFVIIDQRLTMVDDRLSNIEDNMAYKHQLAPKFA